MRTRHALTAAALVALSVLTSTGCTEGYEPSPAEASAPTVEAVDVETARRQLAELTVTDPAPTGGYSRDRFPHWVGVEGACNTREWVLRRDGTGVRTDSRCRPVAGTWTSPYDGATWTNPDDVDIDHVVPLAEAWRSGASGWSTARRRDFANDLHNPQLVAVTDDVNQAKADQDPVVWKPPLATFWCTYARMWIDVKHTWGLTTDGAEVAALGDMLNTCTAGTR